MEAGSADAAVCVTGQLRTLVAARLHETLRAHALDALPADAFLHVDAADTRAWGRQHGVLTRDYEEALRVLRPVAAQIEHFEPPASSVRCDPTLPANESTTQRGGRGGSAMRVCKAYDCGGFKCGCYLPHCTHCEMAQYTPMHDHNRRCLQLVLAHEARRGRPYEFVLKVRPDLRLPSPLPSLARLAAALPRAVPSLCVNGAPPEAALQLGLPLDDKWAIMRRPIADVYMHSQ